MKSPAEQSASILHVNSLAVTWEAVYRDGTSLRERDGAVYAAIDRSLLKSFRLVSPGEILVELPVTSPRTGWNLVYRRRTIHNFGTGKQVWFLAGFVPMGPVVAIQPEAEQIMKADHLGTGAGPLGKVHPTPDEKWLPAHVTDVHLKHQKITLPSGYQL